MQSFIQKKERKKIIHLHSSIIVRFLTYKHMLIYNWYT